MTRTARIVLPDYPHHVTQRGVRSMIVFRNDTDRQKYIQYVRRYCDEAGIEVWAWCLMDNHVHLVVVPKTIEALARGIGEGHRHYTLYFNEPDDAHGHLFQERFHSFPVQVEGYLFNVVRYVECNPVRAGIVQEAEKYPWSSARHHAGNAPDPLVRNSPIRELFPQWTTVLREQSVKICDEIRAHTRSGMPYGSDAWIQQLEHNIGRSLRPSPMGRPKRRPTANEQ